MLNVDFCHLVKTKIKYQTSPSYQIFNTPMVFYLCIKAINRLDENTLINLNLCNSLIHVACLMIDSSHEVSVDLLTIMQVFVHNSLYCMLSE